MHDAPQKAGLRGLLTRRGMLKLGAGFVVAGLVGAGLGVRSLIAERPAATSRRVFDDEEAAVLSALADTWFPPGNVLGVAGADVDVVGSVDSYASRLLPRERKLLRILLRAVNQWPRISLSSTSPFAALAVEQRQAVMRHFEESSLVERRLLATVLRSLIGMPMFDDARLLKAIAHRHGCGLPILQDAP